MKNYNDRTIRNSIQKIKTSELSERNTEVVLSTVRKMKLDKAELDTVRSFLSCMKRLAPVIDFDLRDASREDIEDLALVINNESDPLYGADYGSYAAWTHADDKSAVQTVFKYMDREYECLFKDIRLTPKASERDELDPEQLISASEAEKLIESVEHPRDRCFLGLLWDTGMRRKEIGALKWKDVVPMEDGLIKIHVREGKNGARTVFVYESVPLIDNWLTHFPRAEPEDSLWIDKRCTRKKKEVGYRALEGIVENARENAAIPGRRKTNLHAWRKARATNMAANGMNQPAMERFFGWVAGSRMPRIYIKLASVDLENQVRDLYDLSRKRKKQKFIGENLEEYEDREPELKVLA